MTTTSNSDCGSTLDDLLAADGALAEAEAVAVKRVIAWQIDQAMAAEDLGKAEMARRMNTSRAALDRLLDPDNASVTLRTLQKAAVGLGGVGAPHVRHLTGPLWEMRLRGKGGISRALYVTVRDRRVVVVRAFVKKTPKTPRREIDLALRRAAEVLQ